MVPPHHQRRQVSSNSDNSLQHNQLYQQVVLNRYDINNRDSKIDRLQELNLAYKVMIDQILHSTSACLDCFEVLSFHHFGFDCLAETMRLCHSAAIALQLVP
jgi:hypothetical protein